MSKNMEEIVLHVEHKDTDIPAEHWAEFAGEILYQNSDIWEAALEAVEQAYEEWKDDSVCPSCDTLNSEGCECAEKEEAEYAEWLANTNKGE